MSTSWWLETLKITEKIIWENAFEHQMVKHLSAFKQLGPGRYIAVTLTQQIIAENFAQLHWQYSPPGTLDWDCWWTLVQQLYTCLETVKEHKDNIT